MVLHYSLTQTKIMCMTKGLVGRMCLMGCHAEDGNIRTFHYDPQTTDKKIDVYDV